MKYSGGSENTFKDFLDREMAERKKKKFWEKYREKYSLKKEKKKS
jgi:hypothetical protein